MKKSSLKLLVLGVLFNVSVSSCVVLCTNENAEGRMTVITQMATTTE